MPLGTLMQSADYTDGAKHVGELTNAKPSHHGQSSPFLYASKDSSKTACCAHKRCDQTQLTCIFGLQQRVQVFGHKVKSRSACKLCVLPAV